MKGEENHELTCLSFGVIFTIAGFIVLACGKAIFILSSWEKHDVGREGKD